MPSLNTLRHSARNKYSHIIFRIGNRETFYACRAVLGPRGTRRAPGKNLLGAFNSVGIGAACYGGVWYFTQLLYMGPGGFC